MSCRTAWEGQWVSTRRRVVYWVEILTVSLTSSPVLSFKPYLQLPPGFWLYALSSPLFSFGGCGRFRLVSAIPCVFSRLLIAVVVVVRLAAVACDEEKVSYVVPR
jgi:hypothetical protein